MSRGAYKKKAQNIVNVRARHDFLIETVKTPARIDKGTRAALVGQRAFAALNLPNLNIKPIALNTLKSLSNELFTAPDGDGRTGFAYIDALRIKSVKLLSETAVTRTVSAKAAREEQSSNQLDARLAATEAQSIKRQKAYLSLYAALNGLIKNGNLQAEAQERLYSVLENHHAAFASLFEADIGNATSIESKATKVRKINKQR